MSDQTTIQEIREHPHSEQVRMIREADLEIEVDLQSGKIADALLSKTMRTDQQRKLFLQEEVATILKQVGTIYQCTEFTFVEDGSQGFALTR